MHNITNCNASPFLFSHRRMHCKSRTKVWQDLIKAKATEFECDVKCAGVIKIDTKRLIKCLLLS